MSTLLPDVIKQNAQTDPHGVFAQVPAGTAYTDGFRNITKLQLHNAVNYTASLIKQHMGESKTFETLAFIGASDPRYSIMMVAGIKVGYKVGLFRCRLMRCQLTLKKVFLPSPRNSEEAHLSLLDRLKCTKLVMTEPQAPCIPVILRNRKLRMMTLPSLSQLLEVGDVQEYPYKKKSFAEAKSDPLFVLHTSGSTGKQSHSASIMTSTNRS
jgi:acyl-coenzyme A synthetase/AMP-(fatty) acid ligase